MIVIIEKFGSLDDRIVFTPARPWSCTLSGYVTCSSMSWGVRPIQSANTITWFSDKSGIASTGVCTSAYPPPTATPSHSRITSQRLRTEYSMIRAIMGSRRFFHEGHEGHEEDKDKDVCFEFIRVLRVLRGQQHLSLWD